jgi:hypothetical protein
MTKQTIRDADSYITMGLEKIFLYIYDGAREDFTSAIELENDAMAYFFKGDNPFRNGIKK